MPALFEGITNTAEANTAEVVDDDESATFNDEAEGLPFNRESSVDSKGKYSPEREPE